MKSTGKNRISGMAAVLAVCILFLSGCGKTYVASYTIPVTEAGAVPRTADFFASDLCVPDGDVSREGVHVGTETHAGLFNATTGETLYARGVYDHVNPASLTKVMTALVAIENGDLTKTIVATTAVNNLESGAQKLGIKEGDRMTLDQALHIMLIYSANDVSIMVAEGVAGSVDRFSQMMNERAQTLGATGCHFTNPHGLTESGHYVTTYDMYLIFNEAMKYKEFREIVNTQQYLTSYRTAEGTEIPVDIRTTNGFLSGAYEVPQGTTVVGGKTGTTSAAGYCLIQMLNNTRGDELVAVVMHAEDGEALKNEMTNLMKVVN